MTQAKIAVGRSGPVVSRLILRLVGTASLLLAFRSPYATLAATERELSSEYLKSIESKLSDYHKASQLELYDKLIYGKGDFVRIEGKSRKCLIVSLENAGRYLAKLFDLPESQLREAAARKTLYFTGVCSKIESPSNGTVEVTVTYSLLTSTTDRIYTTQAQTYARRAEESQKKNQALLTASDGASQSGVLSPQSAPNVAIPRRIQTRKGEAPIGSTAEKEPQSTSPHPASDSTKTGKSDAAPEKADDDEEAQEPEGPRPRLIRRGSPPKESLPPASAPTDTAGPSPVESVQTDNDQDIVIYRRAKAGSSSKEETDARANPSINRSNLSLSPALQPVEDSEGMVLIPAGPVTLGSDDPRDSEKPVHRVMVKSFYLDKYEVTNLEYKQFCDATGRPTPPHWIDRAFPKSLEKHPVTEISWEEAMAFARWAGKRLPTESEWERAAKGPNATRYAYGNAYDATKANTETRQTTSVGSYPAGGFGVFDLTGNVAEWTSSLFKPYPYSASDGREELGVAGSRVVRGGHYSSGARDSRCLVRAGVPADRRVPTIGFRCARDAR